MNEEETVDFWNERYGSGRMPWDYGGTPPDLKRYLEKKEGTGRILVPGCGAGYEIRAFSEAGYDVTGIDFSPAAVERAKTVLGSVSSRVIVGDFFSATFENQSFDWIYERTFLCALPPALRTPYAERMRELLKPHGLLFGFFLYGEEEDPPPHPLRPGEGLELFAPAFRVEESRPSQDPLPMFKPGERWEIWRKLGGD